MYILYPESFIALFLCYCLSGKFIENLLARILTRLFCDFFVSTVINRSRASKHEIFEKYIACLKTSFDAVQPFPVLLKTFRECRVLGS